jgi:ribosome-associated protein
MTDDDVLRVTGSLAIPLSELTWRFTASGGPGGQHAARNLTRAEVRFDVAGSPSLSQAQRERLLGRLGAEVRAQSADERSQLRNREQALRRLSSKLAAALRVETPRRPTRPTKASTVRRLEAKHRRSEVKRHRRPPED